MRLRSPILAALLIVPVLALLWRHDRPEALDRYDQRFYLGIAFDLRHHARFTDGFLFAGGDDATLRPSGMRFTPLYPALLAAASVVDPGFAAATDCVVAHRGDAGGCSRHADLVRWLQFGMLAACFWMIWWQAAVCAAPFGAPAGAPAGARAGARNRTRWIALAVALPTAPLLLLSVDYLMTEITSLFLVMVSQSLALCCLPAARDRVHPGGQRFGRRWGRQSARQPGPGPGSIPAHVSGSGSGRRAVWWALASGLALGLATLARPAFLLLAVASIAGLAILTLRHRARWRPSLAFAIGAGLPIGAWIGRNTLVMHRTALSFGYASHTFVQRLSFNTMSWREYRLSFVCWMPDGNGLGAMLAGRHACDRFGWDDHADSFYAIGIGPMLADTLRRAGGWEHHGAFLVRTFLFAHPLRQIGWHLMVTVPLALRGLFVDHWWGLVLSIPCAALTVRALLRRRRALREGSSTAAADRFLLVALPGWFMLAVNAGIAVNQTRYNLMLVDPFAVAAALAIEAVCRRYRNSKLLQMS